MKFKPLIPVFWVTLATVCFGQDKKEEEEITVTFEEVETPGMPNFSGYDKVTDPAFKEFLGLFDEMTLPISTTDIFKGSVWTPEKQPMNQSMIRKFLTTEFGTVVTGPLGGYTLRGSYNGEPVYGDVYPMFKLPTNGNYILLVIAHISPSKTRCFGTVSCYLFTLEGKYVNKVCNLYRPDSRDIEQYIDQKMRTHYIGVMEETDNWDYVFPRDKAFYAIELHEVYEFDAEGMSKSISSERKNGRFQFDQNECRFERVK